MGAIAWRVSGIVTSWFLPRTKLTSALAKARNPCWRMIATPVGTASFQFIVVECASSQLSAQSVEQGSGRFRGGSHDSFVHVFHFPDKPCNSKLRFDLCPRRARHHAITFPIVKRLKDGSLQRFCIIGSEEQ